MQVQLSALGTLREAVQTAAGRLVTDAYGNMALPRVAQVTVTALTYILAGTLTHTIRALELGVDFG